MSREKILQGVKAAVEALEDKKAENVVVLYIGKITTIADYFVIANAKNPNQLQAMADAVQEAMFKAGINRTGGEGIGNKNWVLLDYNDIVVHLFDEKSREFYDLERIWADAEKTEL